MTKISYGRDGLMVVAAFRYCLGRMTYITSDCAEWLIDQWPLIPERTKAIIQRELEQAFIEDDNDRAEGSDYKTLGHDCDRSSWERVRKLWQ